MLLLFVFVSLFAFGNSVSFSFFSVFPSYLAFTCGSFACFDEAHHIEPLGLGTNLMD